MIRFASSQNLYYALACAGVLIIFLIWSERTYRRQSAIFAKPRTLKLTNPYLDFRRPALHICLVVASVIFIGLALSRPQWGFYWAGEKDKGMDVVLALDLSKSMASQDLSPDRITRAKDGISNFAGKAEGDRLALIGFSGDAFLFCPLTMNRNTFQRSLDAIGIGSVKRGGTSYYNMVVEAARSFNAAGAGTKTLVVISDGDDTEGNLDKAIAEAKKEGITIYSVGVGTAEGGVIPVTDKDGKIAMVKDEKGSPVRARLDEAALKRMAVETGGIYERYAKDTDALEKIKAVLGARIKDDTSGEIFGRNYKERFQVPLLMAFMLLVLDLFLSVVNQSKKR